MRADLANWGDGLVESALGWWELAGLDTLVDEAPRDWLVPTPAATRPVVQEAPAAPPKDRIPDTLEDLAAWISNPENLPSLGPQRVAPSGSLASGIMVVTDTPGTGDEAIERLFDGMLAAIGRDRASVYLSSYIPTWLPGGILESHVEAELTQIARQHVALAAPRVLLLMGDATSRALIGTALAQARGKAHRINFNGTEIVAIATFHPRFLIKQPARKADTWSDLRLLLEMLES